MENHPCLSYRSMRDGSLFRKRLNRLCGMRATELRRGRWRNVTSADRLGGTSPLPAQRTKACTTARERYLLGWLIPCAGVVMPSVPATLTMPIPLELKVGDRVRFVSLPEEWKQPGYSIQRESVAFMKRMVKRTSPARVAMIDEYGTPWIFAQTIERGKKHYHSWAITEATGWRLVIPRRPKKVGKNDRIP